MKINSRLGGDISKTVAKSKSVIIFSENFGKLGHVKPRKHFADLGKLLQGKTDGLVMNKKRINLRQKSLSLSLSLSL